MIYYRRRRCFRRRPCGREKQPPRADESSVCACGSHRQWHPNAPTLCATGSSCPCWYCCRPSGPGSAWKTEARHGRKTVQYTHTFNDVIKIGSWNIFEKIVINIISVVRYVYKILLGHIRLVFNASTADRERNRSVGDGGNGKLGGRRLEGTSRPTRLMKNIIRWNLDKSKKIPLTCENLDHSKEKPQITRTFCAPNIDG